MIDRPVMLRLALAACCISISSCSTLYELHLEGQIVRGQSQDPVWDAKITIFAGDKNFESTKSNRHGRWKLHHTLDEAEFETTQNNKKRLRRDVDNPLSIRVEFKETRVEILCPHVAIPESASDINAFVLVVLDAEHAE